MHRRPQVFLRGVASRAGFEPRIMLVADDYVVMQSLVAHRLGVTLVPDLALSAHRDDRLVARTLVGWPDGRWRWSCGRTSCGCRRSRPCSRR